MPAALALSSLSCAADLLGIEARITVKALLPGGQPLTGAGVVVVAGVDDDAADPPVSVPVAPAAGAGAGVVLEAVGAGVAVEAVGALSAGALCGGAVAAGAAAVVLSA